VVEERGLADSLPDPMVLATAQRDGLILALVRERDKPAKKRRRRR